VLGHNEMEQSKERDGKDITCVVSVQCPASGVQSSLGNRCASEAKNVIHFCCFEATR